MKKRLTAMCLFITFVCLSLLIGCSKDNELINSNDSSLLYNEFTKKELKSVKQVGEVPEEFKDIVKNNVFYNIIAFEERLLNVETISKDEKNRTITRKIKMMDLYGKELATYSFSSDDAYHVCTLTSTNDGGFLFVLGFEDYAYDKNAWASDKGFASRVIKCDKNGIVQFDTAFEQIESYAFDFCFEKEGRYYFFGDTQTPETKTRGVYSPTDIYMAIIDKNGSILKTQCIAGSDYDKLYIAEMSGDNFILSISSQSDDGDFADSNSKGYPVDWVVTINDRLETVEMKRETGRDYFDDKIGEKDGTPIHISNPILDGFDGGTPKTFIDYGGFYLIVSENNTGEYENTPTIISSTWYYTETVYSAYDNNGELMFRASVDSSPDFDKMWSKFS